MANKQIYLTIDDAPSIDFMNKVNYLHDRKIPAVFFCIGSQIEKNTNEIINAIQKGFIIGNHSYDHPNFSDLNIDQIKLQILKTDQIIKSIYENLKLPYTKLFRFPYGNKGTTKNYKLTQEILWQMGYQHPYFEYHETNKDIDVLWTFDTEDYKTKDLNKILNRIDNINYEIFLIHDHANNCVLFSKVIDYMIQKKVKFKKIERAQAESALALNT